MNAPPRGTLFLMVGPSGAGKDTLIRDVRARLARKPEFAVAQRYVTRQNDETNPIEQPVDKETFARLRRAGAFCLWWEAHGLLYGVPAEIEAWLEGGRPVLANVSRTVIGEARTRFQPLKVIEVTASQETLRARLLARGREPEVAVRQRLDRANRPLPPDADIFTLVNEGPPEASVERLLAVLGGGNSAVPRTSDLPVSRPLG